MPKSSIRAKYLAERTSLRTHHCLTVSVNIQEKLVKLNMFSRARCIALYSAIRNEVLTDTLANCALKMGKRVAFPRIDGEELEFIEIVNLCDLAPGTFGVHEPTGNIRVTLNDLDLMVIPGVVFDRSGHRLGYGRGYYDRTLKNCPHSCKTIGFAYDFQLIDSLPIVEEHDQKLSLLITEKRVLNFSNQMI